MIDPVVFHIAWFFVGLAMMGIPIVLSEKFEALNKTNLRKDIVEFIIFVGGMQLFSVFFGSIVVATMEEFNPFLCFVIGNVTTIGFMIIGSRMD